MTKSNDNVQIWRSKLIGDVIPDDTLEFTDCKTCVKCIPTEAPVAPPTVPVTTTTTTTTTMPTTTTKKPCSKPLDGAKIINSLDANINLKQDLGAKDILGLVTFKKSAKSKIRNIKITDVQPRK